MSQIKSNAKPSNHQHTCCCQHGHGHGGDGKISKEMIVRHVVEKYPQTAAVFAAHKVDFCCGGAHSIEQTARARGCDDIEALVADLNRAIA